MHMDAWQQGALTALFLATALHSVVEAGLPPTTLPQVVNNVLHAAMSLDMAAMVWPWWQAIPATPQIGFFAAAALWYLSRMLRVLTSPGGGGLLTRMCAPGSGAGHDHHGIRHAGTHMLMMVTMVWMVPAMRPEADAHMPDPASEHAGMHMMGLPPALAVGGAVLAALLIACTLPFLVDLATRSQAGPRRRLIAGANVAMLAGMFGMTWPMVVM